MLLPDDYFRNRRLGDVFKLELFPQYLDGLSSIAMRKSMTAEPYPWRVVANSKVIIELRI
jgi:hypothetical protein